MKALLYSDVHFSQDSSIVRSMGNKYSTRLEYLVKSLNWAEDLAEKEGCSVIFNLGDMFDKPTLNAMELTALKDVKWANIEHFILVGNHDSNVNSLDYSSTEVLAKIPHFNIVSKIGTLILDKTLFWLLPYITEQDRKPLSYYHKLLDENTNVKRKIILSHNDLKGIQLGKYVSQEGFDINDISNDCDLCLNGHIHNSNWINKKILNLGDLCGQTFNEDSFKYKHCAYILDTDTLSIKPYENPYSLNFYKIEINEKHPTLKNYSFKNNVVLMIRCERRFQEKLRKELEENKNIIASKILIYDENISSNKEENIKIEKLDYLKTFNDFILNNMENNDIIKEELNKICK